MSPSIRNKLASTPTKDPKASKRKRLTQDETARPEAEEAKILPAPENVENKREQFQKKTSIFQSFTTLWKSNTTVTAKIGVENALAAQITPMRPCKPLNPQNKRRRVDRVVDSSVLIASSPRAHTVGTGTPQLTPNTRRKLVYGPTSYTSLSNEDSSEETEGSSPNRTFDNTSENSSGESGLEQEDEDSIVVPSSTTTSSSSLITQTPQRQGLFRNMLSVLNLFARGVTGNNETLTLENDVNDHYPPRHIGAPTPIIKRRGEISAIVEVMAPPPDWRERVPSYEYRYDEEIQDSTMDFDPFLFIRGLQLSEEYTQPLSLDNVPCAGPKKRSSPKMTLVLDLDETLVHCTTSEMPNCDFKFPIVFSGTPLEVRVRQRPYLQYFLRTIAKHYEIIVFTASQSIYANSLLDILDPDGLISHRLFRESCRYSQENFLKDLSVLKRDLSKLVIIDNSITAYAFHVNNGIPIVSWFDDAEDVELLSLIPFLEALTQEEDVRPIIEQKFKLQKLVAASELVYPSLASSSEGNILEIDETTMVSITETCEDIFATCETE